LSNPSLDLNQDLASKFILKCLNQVNVLHKASGPEVAEYLLGFPDHYTSEKFTKIFVGEILDIMKSITGNTPQLIQEFKIQEIDGKLSIQNQLLDYRTCHIGLEGICLHK
jgi:hypothetical protein